MPSEISTLILKLRNKEFNRGLDMSNKKLDQLAAKGARAEKGITGLDASQKSAVKGMGGYTTKIATGTAAVVGFNKVSKVQLSNTQALTEALKRIGNMKTSAAATTSPAVTRARAAAMLALSKKKAATEGAALATNKLTTASKGLSTAQMAVAGAVLIAAAALVKFGISAVSAANAQELVEAKLTGVLRATGNMTGYTKDQLLQMAAAMQDLTGVSDNLIINMQGVLATFKNIRGPQFGQAVRVIVDMSKVLEQDLKSSAIQVGKALNDPVAGISALSRVGVNFTDKQKSMIRNFMAQNKVMEAQAVILSELRSEFGGTAELMGSTDAGKLDKMSQVWGDFTENVGKLIKKLTPLQSALQGVANILKHVNNLADSLSNSFKGLAGDSSEFGTIAHEIKRGLGGIMSPISVPITLLSDLLGKAPAVEMPTPGKTKPFDPVAATAMHTMPTALVGDARVGSVGAARVRAMNGMRQVNMQIADNTKRAAEALERMEGGSGGGGQRSPNMATPASQVRLINPGVPESQGITAW